MNWNPFRTNARPYTDVTISDTSARRAAICAEYDEVLRALELVREYVGGFNGRHHGDRLADAAAVELANKLRSVK